jgi:hypothetical protein
MGTFFSLVIDKKWSRPLGSTAVSTDCLGGETVSPVEGNLLEVCNHFQEDKKRGKIIHFSVTK